MADPQAVRALSEVKQGALARALPIVVLCIGAAIPLFTWWRGQQLVWGLDGSFPLNLSEINRYFHLSSTAYQAPDARKLSFIFPWALLLRGWAALGLPWSAAVAQRIYEVGMLMASGLGARALVRRLIPGVGNVASTLAALFYSYNVYALTTVWTSQSFLIVHYSLLPIWTLVMVDAVAKGGWRDWCWAGLAWTLLMSPAYITTPLVVTDVGILVVVGVLSAGARQVPWRRVGTSLLGISGTWVALNLYWLVPLAKTYSVTYAQGIASLSGAQSVDVFRLNSAPLSAALRLGGYWGLHGGFAGSPYYPWASWENPLTHALGYVPIALAAVAMCTLGTRLDRDPTQASHRGIAVLTVVLAALVLLATGGDAPLGSAKVDLFRATHLLAPFRSVYQRFMEYIPLFLAPLMAAGIDVLVRRAASGRNRPWGLAVLLGALAAVVVVPFPLWSGALYDRSGSLPSDRISVPASYTDAARAFLGSPKGTSLLVLPLGTTNVTYLSWNGGSHGFMGIQPLSFLSTMPVVDAAPPGSRVRRLLTSGLQSGEELCSSLGQLNIGYVAWERDADTSLLQAVGGYLAVDSAATRATLHDAPCLRPLRHTTALVIYRDVRWRPSLVSFEASLGGTQVPAQYLIHGEDVISIRPPRRRYQFVVLNEPNDGGWSLDGRAPIDIRDETVFHMPSDPGASFVLSNTTTSVMRTLLYVTLALALAITVLWTGRWTFIARRRRTRRKRRADGSCAQQAGDSTQVYPRMSEDRTESS